MERVGKPFLLVRKACGERNIGTEGSLVCITLWCKADPADGPTARRRIARQG